MCYFAYLWWVPWFPSWLHFSEVHGIFVFLRVPSPSHCRFWLGLWRPHWCSMLGVSTGKIIGRAIKRHGDNGENCDPVGEGILHPQDCSRNKTPTKNHQHPAAEIWADAMVEISEKKRKKNLSKAFIKSYITGPEELIFDLSTQGGSQDKTFYFSYPMITAMTLID